MMNGKEKLYFLLISIVDAKAIAPSGQPLTIDRMNDLNNKIRDVELTRLFTKLEKDEQVLKVLKVPSRIKEIDIVEDLDPYDRADDGCWHIELLPAFDGYFSKIQQEPEYQEFTGKKPASSPTKPNSNTLMTYERKLDLIVKAVVDARKATRRGQPTMLYLGSTNGLDSLDREEIRNILLQLQDEDALKLNPKTNRLLPLSQQPANPTYFLLDILDGFTDWYANYLMQQKSRPKNLDWLNLLKVFDVCSDIDQQIQMTRNAVVTVPSFPYPYIGRFLELFPYDSIGTRKSYQQHRWEGAQYLLKEGIALEAKYDNDDTLGYGNMVIRIDPVKFDDFYKAIKGEFEKRKKTFEQENKPETHTTVSKTVKEEAVWSDEFKWEGKDFVFGKYGSINLVSSDRKHILKVLTDKKGGWATISELKGNKDAGYVRSTIKQIEDRLPEKAKGHIKIISTQDDDGVEKPNAGAYRIKVQP